MGVNLSEARLSNCDFNKAMIGPYRPGKDSEDILHSAKNDSDIIRPDFSHANLSRNAYTDSKIIEARFDYTNMKGTRASNTTFERCDFSKADLMKSKFMECSFDGCTLPDGFESMCVGCRKDGEPFGATLITSL